MSWEHPEQDRKEIALLTEAQERIRKLEAEKESWGNEFSAVIALKDQLAKQTRLINELMGQLRDYRNSHHSEHPSQEGKAVCAYAWCANATRLIAESAESARLEGKFIDEKR